MTTNPPTPNGHANGHKRAVLYGRVSGDDRDTDGRNLKGQIEMGREHSAKRGYRVVGELPEDARGASGAEIDLPRLNQIRQMAAAGKFDVLVVREIDRLSRNLAKQLIVEEELKRFGVEIDYVLGEYPDTPEGNFMKHVRASVAEFEREKIKERMTRGRRQKAASGQWVGNCMPFGYRRIGQQKDAQLAIDEAEAAIVRRIFRWYAREGWSLRAIATRLTEEAVTPPGAAYNKPSTTWGVVSVRATLKNRSYIGEFRYAGHVIPLPEMALVSVEDFEAAANRLKHNRGGYNRKPSRYLLLGRVLCACKRHLTGSCQKGQYFYYECSSRSYILGTRNCTERYVRADILEGMLWAWLSRLMEDEDYLRAGLEGMAAEREAALKPVRDQIADVDRLAKRADRTIAGLMAMFDPDDEDEGVQTALKGQVEAQKQLKKALAIERAKLEVQLTHEPITPQQVEDVVEFARKVKARMGRASRKGKLNLMAVLNVQIYIVYEDGIRKVKMTCDLPGSEFTESLEPRALRGNVQSNGYDSRLPGKVTFTAVAPLPTGRERLADNWLEHAAVRIA